MATIGTIIISMIQIATAPGQVQLAVVKITNLQSNPAYFLVQPTLIYVAWSANILYTRTSGVVHFLYMNVFSIYHAAILL